jgi:hypothetical protein
MTVKLTKISLFVKFDEKEGNRPDVVVVRGGGANENRRGLAAVKEAKNLKLKFSEGGGGVSGAGFIFWQNNKNNEKAKPLKRAVVVLFQVHCNKKKHSDRGHPHSHSGNEKFVIGTGGTPNVRAISKKLRALSTVSATER